MISSTKTPPGRQSSFWEQIPPEPHCGSEKTPLRSGIAPRMLSLWDRSTQGPSRAAGEEEQGKKLAKLVTLVIFEKGG